MANTPREVPSALTVSATLLTASPAAAADHQSRTIVLHVDDYASLPPSDPVRAGRVGHGVLRGATRRGAALLMRSALDGSTR